MKAFLEVDVRDVVEVARLVESLEARRNSVVAREQGTEEMAMVPKQGSWTRGEVDALVESLELTGVRHLLDMCAARDGWVVKHEAEGDGPGEVGMYTLRAELSGFSKRLASGDLLGSPREYWPMEWRKRDRVYEYRMPRAIAAWWVQARSSQDERDA